MKIQSLSLGVTIMGLWLCTPSFAITPSSTKNLVIQWNETALQAVRNTRFAPPQTSRALAILNTGIYDAWAVYDPVAVGTRLGNSLQLHNSENTLKNKNEAISYAAYRTLVDLFPSQKSLFDALMFSLGYNPNNTSTDIMTPSGVGNFTAQVLLDFRHNDGSNQLGNLSASGIPYSDYTGYTPVNTATTVIAPDRWQPLLVSDGQGGFVEQQFLVPHWNRVIPFALESNSQFRPNKPALADSPKYRRETKEVYQISLSLTDKQKAIAQYWADGPSTETPPGHWHLFAIEISARDRHTLDEDVKMFFTLSNSVFDASIAAWDAKVAYDYARPITAIRYLIDPNWVPFISTPPFAEYVSGHSTFSAAASEILKRFTGSDAFGLSNSDPETGITLSWATFSQAADEAGISRRYGGIHFRDGDVSGRKLGRLVGVQTWNKALTYIRGTAQ